MPEWNSDKMAIEWRLFAVLAVLSTAVCALRVTEEGPFVTGKGFRVTGYEIDVNRDLADVIGRAKQQKQELEVFAGVVSFKNTINVQGIPKLRVFAHRCIVDGFVEIVGQGENGEFPAGAGTDASAVELLCGGFESTDPLSRGAISLRLHGGSGGRGEEGRRGAAGRAATEGVDGVCKGKGFKCVTRGNAFGVHATDGEQGGEGGQGGDGGRGGSLVVATYLNEETVDVSRVNSQALGSCPFIDPCNVEQLFA